MFQFHSPPAGSSTSTGKTRKRGFSLVELIVVILIIAILAVAVFAGGSAAIKKAQKARAISDLHNFQIAVAMTMNENPQIANIEAATKRDKLSAIMDALNANLPTDYKVTLQTAAMDGNISMAAQADVNADFIICKSEKTDAWDNPYFVIIDSAQRGGSAASEFYMTTLTAGPNAILNLTGTVDKDDIFDLTSYSDGDVISATYDVSDAVPTIVGGTAAATSYTDPAAAPVNNGETTEFGAVSIISFSLYGEEYQAEEGMTWAEWCNSEYNTSLSPTYAIHPTMDRVVDISLYHFPYVCTTASFDSAVSSTSTIIANHMYWLLGGTND